MPRSAVDVAYDAVSRLQKDVRVPSFDDRVLKALGESLTANVDSSRTLNVGYQ